MLSQKKKYIVAPGWTKDEKGEWKYYSLRDLLTIHNVCDFECVVSVQGTIEHIREVAQKANLTILRPKGA